MNRDDERSLPELLDELVRTVLDQERGGDIAAAGVEYDALRAEILRRFDVRTLPELLDAFQESIEVYGHVGSTELRDEILRRFDRPGGA